MADNREGGVMFTPYNERCKGCPFEGEVTRPVFKSKLTNLRYIDCQRDNEDAKERWKNSGKSEDLDAWTRQSEEFQHCIYYYIDFPKNGGGL
jgi:hypothetical protein